MSEGLCYEDWQPEEDLPQVFAEQMSEWLDKQILSWTYYLFGDMAIWVSESSEADGKLCIEAVGPYSVDDDGNQVKQFIQTVDLEEALEAFISEDLYHHPELHFKSAQRKLMLIKEALERIEAKHGEWLHRVE